MIDTRSFVEICKGLDSRTRLELCRDIQRRTLVTDATVRNWRLGYKRPLPIYRKSIVNALKRIGIQSNVFHLFPYGLPC